MSSRSSSPLSSRSRSRSASPSSSPGGRRPRSSSPASSASSRMSSRSRSRSRSPASSRSQSPLSSRSPSPQPEKMKLKVKINKRGGGGGGGKKSSGGESDEEEEEEEKPRKKKSPVKRKKKPAKAEEEEGEVSSDNFDDGLDDDLIGDDEDRAKLEKMTEREREEELFKRAEIRENERKRFEIQKKLKQQQKLKGDQRRSDDEETAAADKTDEFDYSSLSASGLDTKERSQDRRRNLDAQKFDKKSSALSELKARKQERERKEQERKEKKEAEEKGKDSDSDAKDRGRRKRRDSSSSTSGGSYRRRSSSSSSSSVSSSDSEGGDSDTERFKSKSGGRVAAKKYIENHEDLEPIRLSRHKMERFIHLPFFKRLVIGCFVRIGIGQSQGRSVYRCTEIVEVVETAKIYTIGKQKTNQGLRLRFGKQERVFRLEFVSNSALTPTEFSKWKSTCEEQGVAMPTKDFVQQKADEIKKAVNYEFTSADVDQILQKKEKFTKNPVNYAMTKAKLMKEKEIADAENDHEKANEIEEKLKELEQRAEELDKRRTEKSSISSVSLINDRNRKRNVLKAEQAIQEEIKRKEIEGVEDNPFTRRKCNPRMVTKNVDNDGEVITSAMLAKLTAEKENNKDSLKRKGDEDAAAPATNGKDENAGKKPRTLEKAKSKEDLFDAHNFDIEIDVGASIGNGSSGASSIPSASTGGGSFGAGSGSSSRPGFGMMTGKETTGSSGPAKRSLNLSDYKKKRGLI